MTGCGIADSGPEDEDRNVLSKAAFVRRADGICEKADRIQVRLRDHYLKEHPGAERSQGGQARMLEVTALPPLSSEVEKLIALGVPDVDAAETAMLFEELEEASQEAEGDPKSIVEGKWPFTEAEKRAKKLGFKACARPT